MTGPLLAFESYVWTSAALVRVVDTDTLDFDLTCDIGFRRRVSGVQRVRLNRCDGYTLHTPAGDAGAAYVAAVLSVGPITVETLKPYKYGGEYMAEVLLRDGTNLTDLLIREGHALPYDGRGPRPAKTAGGA